MKKVLIFSLSYYPHFTSGAEAAIREITDRIEDLEFHLITNRYDSTLPKDEIIGNVHVHRIGIATKRPTFTDLGKLPLHLNKPLFQFLAALKALSLHRRNHFDAIWAMMAHSAGIPAALFKLFHPKVPYVLTLQEGDPPEHIERVMRPLWPLFKRAFAKADVVQSISVFLGAWARKMGFSGPLEIIRNGANPRDLAPSVSEEELEQLKHELGKGPDDLFLVNTARLEHQKGWDTTVRALADLPDRVKLLVVGAGSEEEKLRALVQELGLTERVVFTGQVDRSKVTAYRLVSDIFVGPSRSEGLGNAFLSAMASRLPVVATQVGGLADFLFDAKRNPDRPTTGWAVDPDAPEQIVQAVRDIMEHPEEVRRVTDTARDMVFKEYNWDVIAREMRARVFGRLL